MQKKSFSEAGGLKRHIHTVHEGRKDFKCEPCDKSFSQAGILKRHSYTVHEGHKDFKCETCNTFFSRAGGLKRHNHIVHEGQLITNVMLVVNYFLYQEL